jgi:predicted transcriptional regulator YheO
MTADAEHEMSEFLFYAIVAARVEEYLESACEVTLTDLEREALQAWITEARITAKRPRGRPSADTAMIAIECKACERSMPLKAAVDIIAKRHGVSHAVVYAARHKCFPLSE